MNAENNNSLLIPILLLGKRKSNRVGFAAVVEGLAELK